MKRTTQPQPALAPVPFDATRCVNTVDAEDSASKSKRKRTPKTPVTATCQCPYHKVADGVIAGVFAMPTDNTSHGRLVMRQLLLQHAEATLSQDWLTVSSVAQRLVLLATLLVQEAHRNLLAEAV